ncbi:MAG: flavodoxin family protein [Clostridiales bacterium]|nr:flavodoxin family protein [Clostridiales bacterium]
MKVSILMGSPKKEGNTATLIKPLLEKLKNENIKFDYITLYDKKIKGCIGCYNCQKVNNIPGCSIDDDMKDIYNSMLSADVVVFATPIYTWFCTAPMKAVLDRSFAFGKHYDKASYNQSLLEGKKYAVIGTCGDEVAIGMESFETAMKNLSKYAKTEYIGSIGIRDINGVEDFKTKEVVEIIEEFSNQIMNKKKTWR